MKSFMAVTLAALMTFAGSAWAYRQVRFTAKAPHQKTHDNAVAVGRALAREIDAGKNRKANSFMRFQKCETRFNGKWIIIQGMNVKEKYVYENGDFVKVYEAVISYINKRCDRDDD